MVNFASLASFLGLAVVLLQLSPGLGGRALRGRLRFPWTRAEAEVERRKLVELAGQFTKADGSSRLDEMERAMATTFAALPKDEHGTLSHDVVRYALHRLFVHKHSWYVRGLDGGSGKTVGSERSVPEKGNFDLNAVPVLPTLLQNSIEHQHESFGLSLKEMAALAASIEDLAHQEAIFHLGQAYAANNLSQDSVLSAATVEKLVDTYFTIYVWGYNFADWSNTTILRRRDNLIHNKRWKVLGGWLRESQKNVTKRLHADGEAVAQSYTDVVQIVESVGDHFGTFNDIECKAMKRDLLAMEGRKPGRVRLSDFYNQTKSGVWYFAEKIDYLRALGALDETNASNPLVIVPNYVTSPPQCLRASSVYDMCCPNECEAFMLQLEGAVGASDASPKALTRLVAGFSSDTEKPRDELPAPLQERLHSVAADHGGRVPLHSQQFALWMHHAFPRECPFPHQEGTTSPLTPDEWMQSTGHSTHVATDDEMDKHIRPEGVCTSPDEQADELPWPEFTTVATFPRDAGHATAVGESMWLLKFVVPCAAFLLASAARYRQSLSSSKDRERLVF